MQNAPQSAPVSSDRNGSDIRSRLVRCFAAVFEDLSPEEIPMASSSLTEWDSMASITLTMLIEEEFGVRIGVSEIARLTSFEEILRFLSDRVG